MRDLTVLGGYGYVGTRFWERHCLLPGGAHPHDCWRNSRDNYDVNTPHCVNFISTVHNYNVWTDPHLDINTNLGLLIDTLESWRLTIDIHGVYNLISSWFVYGASVVCPAHEDDLCEPQGFYSITKRAAEQLLISYCTTYGLAWRILRLGSVVGGHDPKASKRKNAVQWMVNEVAAGRDVELYDDGAGYRHFIHVDDAADAIGLVMNKGELNSIYNIGASPIPVGLVIREAKRMTNSPSRITSIAAPRFHKQVQTTSFTMNTNRLYMLGFRPQYVGAALVDAMLPPRG